MELEPLDPAAYTEEVRTRFAAATAEDLLAIVDSEKTKQGWGTARAIFLSELRLACEARGIDYEARWHDR